MGISRRTFLKTGVLASVAVGIPGEVFGSVTDTTHQAVASHSVDCPQLTQEMFSKHLNSMFSVHSPTSQVAEVQLVQVIDLIKASDGKHQVNSDHDCFAVVFRGPHSVPLNQNTYTVQHPAMGDFKLFLVPGKTSAKGISYEALFNRLSI